MEVVLASSQLGGQLLGLITSGVKFYQAMRDAEEDIPELKGEVNGFSKVIELGRISVETFVKTLSQDDQKQLIQEMDFESLRNVITANAKQAENMLTKYRETTTSGRIRFALDQDKRQDILLKLSRSTNIYTTALVTLLVHTTAMTNTAVNNFERWTVALRELREAQMGGVATPRPGTAVATRLSDSSSACGNSQNIPAKTTILQSPKSNSALNTQKESFGTRILKTFKRPLTKNRQGRRDTEPKKRSIHAQSTHSGFEGGIRDTVSACQSTSASIHSSPTFDHSGHNETALENGLRDTQFTPELGRQTPQEQAVVKSSSITIRTEADQVIEDLGLADEGTTGETGDSVQRFNEAETFQNSRTVSLAADNNDTVPDRKDPDSSFDVSECTAVGCVCQNFGRIEDLFAIDTSMASATNDASPWIFFFFQRFDGWVQLNLIPKDYKTRIIALERIAEAVEQSPLSCVLTSKAKEGTYEQRGSLLRLFFIQLLEDGERHLVERQLDLSDGPPFKWDHGNLKSYDPVPVPANIFRIDPLARYDHLCLICVSPNGELLALDESYTGDLTTIRIFNISISPGQPLFLDSFHEDTGYWQLPFFGGPAERRVVCVYAVGEEMMTIYEIRHWLDDRSSELRIEKSQIRLNWHGLSISPSPNSYLPIYEWRSDEDEVRQMVGCYCKTCDNEILYFPGEYGDEVEKPEFVCSVKAGSQAHILDGCVDLLYISAENELRISRRTVDATGKARHETSCLHRPSNYFVTELDKLVSGPLDGYIPPRVQEIVVEEGSSRRLQ